MANWQTTLRIADLHKAAKAGEITPMQLAHGVAERLAKNKFAKTPEIERLVQIFKSFDEDATPDDYDCYLEQLYNFGDRQHRIWIQAW